MVSWQLSRESTHTTVWMRVHLDNSFPFFLSGSSGKVIRCIVQRLCLEHSTPKSRLLRYVHVHTWLHGQPPTSQRAPSQHIWTNAANGRLCPVTAPRLCEGLGQGVATGRATVIPGRPSVQVLQDTHSMLLNDQTGPHRHM